MILTRLRKPFREDIKLVSRDTAHVFHGIALGTLIMSALNQPTHMSLGTVVLFWASLIIGSYFFRLSSKL